MTDGLENVVEAQKRNIFYEFEPFYDAGGNFKSDYAAKLGAKYPSFFSGPSATAKKKAKDRPGRLVWMEASHRHMATHLRKAMAYDGDKTSVDDLVAYLTRREKEAGGVRSVPLIRQSASLFINGKTDTPVAEVAFLFPLDDDDSVCHQQLLTEIKTIRAIEIRAIEGRERSLKRGCEELDKKQAAYTKKLATDTKKWAVLETAVRSALDE